MQTWKIEEYTPTQIILYKTDSGNCGEHYFVQEHNGVIGIYTVDEYGIKALEEDTEISTLYLPEEDVQNLRGRSGNSWPHKLSRILRRL